MENNNNKVAAPIQNTLERNISEQVLSKITAFQETGSINIPKDYSPANALRAAYLILLETKNIDKKPVLQECTKDSIANALLKMIVQGLRDRVIESHMSLSTCKETLKANDLSQV